VEHIFDLVKCRRLGLIAICANIVERLLVEHHTLRQQRALGVTRTMGQQRPLGIERARRQQRALGQQRLVG
jgi:hypothetical protein